MFRLSGLYTYIRLPHRSFPMTVARRLVAKPDMQQWPACVLSNFANAITGWVCGQDPELGELLDRVEVAYLGMRRERPGMGGMLGALMAAMGS